MKRKMLLFCCAALAVPASLLAEVNVNVNVGIPAPGVVVAGPPPLLFDAPPLFLAPSRLGFYVGVDMPYDMVFVGDSYYLYFGNAWYSSRFYNGPWVMVQRQYLPPVIRRHRLEYIRAHRDREYRVYYQNRDYYRGRYYRPERIVREERIIRDERRDEHRRGGEVIREERRPERGEWREERGRGREHEHRRGD